jgi:hypothetical protein
MEGNVSCLALTSLQLHGERQESCDYVWPLQNLKGSTNYLEQKLNKIKKQLVKCMDDCSNSA